MRIRANDAIRLVRKKRPKSVQTSGQILCVQQFEHYLLPQTVVFSSKWVQSWSEIKKNILFYGKISKWANRSYIRHKIHECNLLSFSVDTFHSRDGSPLINHHLLFCAGISPNITCWSEPTQTASRLGCKNPENQVHHHVGTPMFPLLFPKAGSKKVVRTRRSVRATCLLPGSAP